MSLVSIEIPVGIAEKLKSLSESNGFTERSNLIQAVNAWFSACADVSARNSEKAKTDTPIAKLLAEFDEHTRDGKGQGVERALFLMLDRNRHRLPALDGRFHKTFRQCDVLESAEEDVVVWNLLYDSRLFWELFKIYAA